MKDILYPDVQVMALKRASGSLSNLFRWVDSAVQGMIVQSYEDFLIKRISLYSREISKF